MKKILLLIIGIQLMISLVSAGFYYNVNIHADNQTIKINNVSVVYSNNNLTTSPGEEDIYRAVLGKNSYDFNIPRIEIYDIANETTGEIYDGGMNILEELDFELIIPYNKYEKELIITDLSGKEILRKSLIEFTRLYTKQEYALAKDSENRNQEIESNIEDTKENVKDKNYFWPIVVILLILILIIIIFIVIKNRYHLNRKK